MWGLGAVYAYRAYRDIKFLNNATHIWDQISPWMITLDDAKNGTHPHKQGKIASECQNGTRAVELLVESYSNTKFNKLLQQVVSST